MLKRRPALLTTMCRSVCASTLVLLSAAATASPEPVDGVSRYLIENGMLTAPASSDAPPAKTGNALVGRIRDKASDMVLTAMNFLGVPYRRGGSSAERGFDCSGFTRHVFEMSVGLVLPRRVDDQAIAPGLIKVRREELKPGDLVFFNTLKRTFSHVGIYVGDGKFIHSPRTGGEVRVEDMRFTYWAKRFTGARRAEPVAADPHAAVPAASVIAAH